MLAEWQRELYWDVMVESYQTLVSLGCDAPKPKILLLMEEKGKPYAEDAAERAGRDLDCASAVAERLHRSRKVKLEDHEVEIRVHENRCVSAKDRPNLQGLERRAVCVEAQVHSASRPALEEAHGDEPAFSGKCQTKPRGEMEVPVDSSPPHDGSFWRQVQVNSSFPQNPCCPVKEEIEDGGYGVSPRDSKEEPESPLGSEGSCPWLGTADSPRSHAGAGPCRADEDPSVFIYKTETIGDLEVHVVEEALPGEDSESRGAGWRARSTDQRCPEPAQAWWEPGGERPFHCGRCGNAFRRRSHLTEHLRTHTGEKPYGCSLCAKRFGRRSTLNKHQETHAKEQPREATGGQPTGPGDPRPRCPQTRSADKAYPCRRCHKSFSTRAYAARHERAHLEEKPLAHPLCPEHFGGELGQPHAADKPFPCGLCGSWFRRRSHLSDHLRTHTGEKPFPCSLCARSFSRRSTLNKHQDTHAKVVPEPAPEPPGEEPQGVCHVAEPYPRARCHRSFSMRAYALRHERARREGRPAPPSTGDRSVVTQIPGVQCEASPGGGKLPCPLMQGNGRGSLARGTKEELGVPGGDKPYHCSLCEKRFRLRSALSKHERAEAARRLPRCPQGLRSPRVPWWRQRVSAGEEKPYACGLCGKQFRRRSYLAVHRRVHLEDGPYPCALCDKLFVFKGDFIKHYGFHTGERPYPCPCCARSFRKQSHLTEHLRIHTGEKPYPCPRCGKRFGRRSTLTKHQQLHARRVPAPQAFSVESAIQQAPVPSV
ncbi:zinc finger protein 271-like [Alligator sinensis]|uniref:Zinc finger protein 271-like n=1 Tax=Alligator sinensis TaxID=38654 RepID=A0A3Q0FK24_ALLSI|nr:zinc finger protein 271-like [Alligator sinensis]